jgi:hypothetical protein
VSLEVHRLLIGKNVSILSLIQLKFYKTELKLRKLILQKALCGVISSIFMMTEGMFLILEVHPSSESSKLI